MKVIRDYSVSYANVSVKRNDNNENSRVNNPEIKQNLFIGSSKGSSMTNTNFSFGSGDKIVKKAAIYLSILLSTFWGGVKYGVKSAQDRISKFVSITGDFSTVGQVPYMESPVAYVLDRNGLKYYLELARSEIFRNNKKNSYFIENDYDLVSLQTGEKSSSNMQLRVSRDLTPIAQQDNNIKMNLDLNSTSSDLERGEDMKLMGNSSDLHWILLDKNGRKFKQNRVLGLLRDNSWNLELE